MNSKAELFRKIGWSQELIEHFTICEDVNDETDDGQKEPFFFDSETAVVKFDVANSSSKATVLIK